MSGLSRRRFAGLIALGALGGLARPALAQARAKVVVIGGGAGGATAARYLALSGAAIDITLVEPNARYRTCFFSNLYLGGLRSHESLLHDYRRFSARHGIAVVAERAVSIDPAGRRVALDGGGNLDYDRLIVAPGIEARLDAIPGYDAEASEAMPHAWDGGPQLQLLKRQLGAMPDGGVFVIAPPDNPFRCPPGPYERVSMVSRYFKQAKPKSKILVLDAKNTFAKQPLFQDAWAAHTPGMVEWLPADFLGGIERIDAKAMTVETAAERFEADVACIIPPQRAGAIARIADLADETGWCPVDARTLESRRHPGIHLVGDAIQAGKMPKSGFSANSQAKTCAAAVIALLSGTAQPEPRFFNTCWSFLWDDDAVAVGGSYRVAQDSIESVESFVSARDESREFRKNSARQAEAWYDAFTADIFG